MHYESKTEHVDIPRGSGKKGFLSIIAEILDLPYVQQVVLNSTGRVEYKYYLPSDAKTPAGIDVEPLQPYAIIRNGVVQEMLKVPEKAYDALFEMFAMLTVDRLFPIGFVGSNKSHVFDWIERTQGRSVSDLERGYLMGQPFYPSPRHVEDNVLMLCGGYASSSSLLDTQVTIKILIPKGMK